MTQTYANDPAQLRPPRQLHGVTMPTEHYHQTNAIVEAVLLKFANYARPYRHDPAMAKFVTERALAFLVELETTCGLMAGKSGSNLTETAHCGCTVTKGWRCSVHNDP